MSLRSVKSSYVNPGCEQIIVDRRHKSPPISSIIQKGQLLDIVEVAAGPIASWFIFLV